MKVYLIKDNENKGPYMLSDIKKGIESGSIPPDTLAWLPGADSPVELRSIPQLGYGGNPFAQRTSDPTKVSSIALDIFLTIITLGLFNLYIQYRQMNAINEMLNTRKYIFFSWFFLTIITCGLYHVYHEYMKSNDIDLALGTGSNSPVVVIILSVCGLAFVADAIQQSGINRYYGNDSL